MGPSTQIQGIFQLSTTIPDMGALFWTPTRRALIITSTATRRIPPQLTETATWNPYLLRVDCFAGGPLRRCCDGFAACRNVKIRLPQTDVSRLPARPNIPSNRETRRPLIKVHWEAPHDGSPANMLPDFEQDLCQSFLTALPRV